MPHFLFTKVFLSSRPHKFSVTNIIYIIYHIKNASSVVSHLRYAVLRWGNIEFPLPFGRVLNPTESFVHSLDEKVIHFKASLMLRNNLWFRFSIFD